MEQTIIMPVGVIEESTATGATFRLTPPQATRQARINERAREASVRVALASPFGPCGERLCGLAGH